MNQESSVHTSVIGLFQFLKKTLCEEDYNELNKFASSFLWKIYLSEYHRDEISDAFIRELSCSKQAEYLESLKGIFSFFPEKSVNSKYRIALFKSEAHLIAFAQNLHSTADICANIIVHTLAKLKIINFKEGSRVNLFSVKKLLSSTKMQNLRNSIANISESKEFKYLSAFVNTIKHKEIISTKDFVSFETQTNPTRCLKIESFYYKGKKYESVLSSQLTEEYFFSLRVLYCAVFNELKNITEEL